MALAPELAVDEPPTSASLLLLASDPLVSPLDEVESVDFEFCVAGVAGAEDFESAIVAEVLALVEGWAAAFEDAESFVLLLSAAPGSAFRAGSDLVSCCGFELAVAPDVACAELEAGVLALEAAEALLRLVDCPIRLSRIS